MANLSAPIKAHQLEVLKWIASGCPDGVMTGYSYKTTAKALQGRRLVTAGIKGGAWQATLTDAGQYYLDHGCYPEGLWQLPPARIGRQDRQAPARSRPVTHPVQAIRKESPARASVAAPESAINQLADDLIARIVAAGGPVEMDHDLRGPKDQLLVAASKRAPSLPPGKQLRIRNRSWPHWDIREAYLAEDFTVRVTEREVPVPQRVTRFHPAAADCRQDADRHEVSADSVGRATRILHALAAEAERRGHQATATRPADHRYHSDFRSSLKDGQLRIGINGFTYQIRIRERPGTGGATLLWSARGSRKLPRWRAVRNTVFVPTGSLLISIDQGYSHDGRPSEFRDTKTRTLEQRLPAILRELEIRALEDDWRRQEEQRKADDKRRRWEQAMAQARHDYREAALTSELTTQLQRWHLTRELDQYLAELRASVKELDDQQASSSEWIDWIAGYRQRIDPLRQASVMPAVREPAKDDLKPFLKGWSPYGPDSHS